ncbi:hypothetical protein LSCM1_07592 [Leishmania martiniquensis]|uniref:Uncharacterized protein n=1 Tax=Leishmania martiniquensis TaxID=1580590 RepID=A0A836H259_9TRYP|nr:hypothetical protein LSCM1_07592 [Leishmania martiniquensis]
MMYAKTAAAPANGIVNGHSAESIDDIKDSLDRIERLLNCGQQLLYGDEAVDGEGGAASLEGVPAGAAPASIPIARHVDVSYDSYQSSSQRRQNPSRGVGGGGRLAAHRQLPPAAPHSLPPRNTTNPLSSPQRTPPYHASRARENPISTSSKQCPPRFKKEKMSASLRGRQIAQIQKEGGMVPNLEEGVDASDTAQNMTIAELKERIHRELEEYRRFGPLMHRLESYQRRQRAAVTKRAPANKKGGLRPFPAGTTAAPPTPASRLVKQVPTPGPGVALHRAPSHPGVHAAAAVTTSGPQAAPASRHVEKSKNVTQACSTLQKSQGQAPFWERLYRETAIQQEKRDQRAEQRSVVKRRAKQKPYPSVVAPPLQSTYSGHNNPPQMSTVSRNASCELMSKQTSGHNYALLQQASQLIADVPAAVAAPWRPAPANNAYSTSTHLSSTPSPLPPKPKVDMQQSTYSAEPHDDIELSSSDDAEDSNSPPFIVPLDLSGIKK